jgi:DNA-directed RNA polymerase specialized sigma24 family protein
MFRVPPQDREDVAQDVIVAALRDWSSLVSRPGVSEAECRRRWLMGVTWHRVLQHGERGRRRRESLMAEVPERELVGLREAVGPSPEDLYLRSEELHGLSQEFALEKLRASTTSERWASFEAHVIEGHPIRQISAALGVPGTTIWHRVRLAKSDMRVAIQAERARRAARRSRR